MELNFTSNPGQWAKFARAAQLAQGLCGLASAENRPTQAWAGVALRLGRPAGFASPGCQIVLGASMALAACAHS
jgi:hypothetical protein